MMVPFDPASMARVAPLAAIGLAMTLAALALMRVVGSRYVVNRQVRRDERREPPPPLWRLVWALVRTVAVLIEPLVPTVARRRIDTQLREAGLELALSAVEFTAGRVMLAALGGALGYWLLSATAGSWIAIAMAVAGFWIPAARLRDAVAYRRRHISRDLPMMLDLITMAVQGGTTTSAAIGLAVEQGPHGPLRDELSRVLREVKAGRQRHQALRAMADRYPISGLRHAVGAIISAERQGADLTEILRGQSQQRRHERFLEAERLAMQAPVKMLLPLVLFIFPGTFLILMFPIAIQLLGSGLL